MDIRGSVAGAEFDVTLSTDDCLTINAAIADFDLVGVGEAGSNRHELRFRPSLPDDVREKVVEGTRLWLRRELEIIHDTLEMKDKFTSLETATMRSYLAMPIRRAFVEFPRSSQSNPNDH